MGYKIYGEEKSHRSQLGEFVENFVAGFVTFSYCIGGWLVGFGMPVMWMLALALIVAAIFAWQSK